MTYEITLPFNDMKKIENSLVELPGTAQQISFDNSGAANVLISNAPVPVVVSVTTSADGSEETATTNYPVVHDLCASAARVGGTLTNISLDTSGYRLDDGKLHISPSP
ncbi:MAG: hypothetical protein ABJ239_12125 [Erythrobacter sp.]